MKTFKNFITEAKRNYKKEYRKYHGTAEYRARRSKRVLARRRLEKQGRVRKGDGKDVDHKRALSKGGSNSNSNLRVVPRSVNRAKDNN
jgi:hypothetical protein